MAKPAGTAGRSRIRTQVVRCAPLALTHSLLDIVRNETKSLVTHELDMTKEWFSIFRRLSALGAIQRLGSIFRRGLGAIKNFETGRVFG